MTGWFHEGEVWIQERAGERWRAERTVRVVSDILQEAAAAFVDEQHLAVLGSVGGGRLHASMLLGETGFLKTMDDRTVVADLTRAHVSPGDPFWENVAADPRFGMLLVDFDTRRRLRINGTVVRSANTATFHVEQAYPNCPKYIQRRRAIRYATGAAGEPLDGSALLLHQRELIERADTFFVASAHPRGGVDVSHRGGAPGFVRVLDDGTLSIPDYSGNGMFNTLGNLAADPRAALLFPDFGGPRMLHLAGRAVVHFPVSSGEGANADTGRFWVFHIEATRELTSPIEPGAVLVERSPFNP